MSTLTTVLCTEKLPPGLVSMAETRGLRLLPPLHRKDPAAFEQEAPSIRAILTPADGIVDAALMARLPALKMISAIGVGYDGIDVSAARARGIVVTHVPGATNDDVADLAIGLMLAVARCIPLADQYIRAGEWTGRAPMLGRQVSGARCGILGMGRIGREVATRAAAFKMEVAYTSRQARAELPYRHEPGGARALAAASDFLIVIVPGGAGTRHMVDADVLAALGPKGYLINIARGSVVDEAALIEALENKAIAGAGLDVFENEPGVPERLRVLSNVVLTPHLGAGTVQARERIIGMSLANLIALHQGQPAPTPVPECAPGA